MTAFRHRFVAFLLLPTLIIEGLQLSAPQQAAVAFTLSLTFEAPGQSTIVLGGLASRSKGHSQLVALQRVSRLRGLIPGEERTPS
jgi:hypothetical protein